ncbi:MAG: hypothetical protein JWO32_1844 [Bacteroidetes bacterium]|nr:hypothetical protein [Bacteroidota bacterium]
MSYFVAIIALLCFTAGSAQTLNDKGGVMNVDTIGTESKSLNLYNSPLYSDSLASSFCIVIKQEVKAHKHLNHCEHVIVNDGEGQMKLADKTFSIKKGDVIFIPKNTIHSVKRTGEKPLKVISIQAPFFDGKDRIMIEEK